MAVSLLGFMNDLTNLRLREIPIFPDLTQPAPIVHIAHL